MVHYRPLPAILRTCKKLFSYFCGPFYAYH